MLLCCLVVKLFRTLLQPHRLKPTRLLCPWDFQVRILEWVAISFSRDLPNPAIEFRSPALAAGFFTTEPPGMWSNIKIARVKKPGVSFPF